MVYTYNFDSGRPLVRNNCKILSFTQDVRPDDPKNTYKGYMHLRMWAQYAGEYYKELFFEKNINWAGENEFRFILISLNESEKYIFINIEDTIEGVVLA